MKKRILVFVLAVLTLSALLSGLALAIDAPTVTGSHVASTGKPRLTWTAVNGAEKYQVYRSDSKTGTYTRIGTTSTLGNTDNSAVVGNTYYYKVRAVDANGKTGAFSSPIAVACRTARPAVSVSNVASTGKPRITWAAVDGASQYQVYRGESKDGSYTKIGTTSSLGNTDSSAALGKTYYYKVRALDANGKTGAFSAPKAASCKPARPGGLKAASASYSKIKVTWNAVSGATGYKLYRSLDKENWKLLTDTAETSYVNTGVACGKPYYYKVTAYVTVSGKTVRGEFSSVVKGTAKLKAPTGVSASGTDYDCITVKWKAVDGAQKYQLYRSANGTDGWEKVGAYETTNAVNRSLAPNTTYYYKVRCCRTVNDTVVYSPFSAVVSGSTKTLEADGKCGKNVYWSLDESTGKLIIFGTGKMEEFEYDYNEPPWQGKSISSVVISPGVTSIGSYSFAHCKSLKSITISNGVTSIGDYAFLRCSGLKRVTLPDGVKTIGDATFSYCSSLTSITIPDSLTGIDGSAFRGCRSLVSITIPGSVPNIGMFTFDGCVSLESVTIGNGVKTIDSNAFRACSSLTEITIPDSVSGIVSDAFRSCNSLTAFHVGKGNRNYCSDSKGVLLNKNKTELYQAPEAISGSYSIPNSVKTIKVHAFSNCKLLTSISIPGSVTRIEQYAFEGCAGLKSLTIPNSVVTIGDNAFWNCGMTSVTIGSGVTDFGDAVFQACQSLTSVKLVSGLKKIGDEAFFGCSSLESIAFPESVTYIGNWAFYGCTNLKKVSFPSGIKSIAAGLFEDCSSLESIIIPNSVTSIVGAAFSGCSSLTSVTIPNSVTSIGQSAFSDCRSLTSVTIGSGVKLIENSAFVNCNNLKSVTFRGSAPRIGKSVFANARATVYYPYGDATWTADVRQDYGGTLTWVAY